MRQRPPEERVRAEPLEELRVVGVEREHEPQLVDPTLVGRAQLDDAVRLLPRLADPT